MSFGFGFKKQNNFKKYEENIYGTVYKDTEDYSSENSNEEGKLFAFKNYNNKQSTDRKSEIKIEMRRNESDEELMDEYVKDYSKDHGRKKETVNDKHLEKTLSKKYGKGFAMLKKAGFKVGSGLGVKEQGITDPIKITKRKKKIGLSNAEEKASKVVKEEEAVYNKNDDYFLGFKQKIEDKKREKNRIEIDEFEQFIEKWNKIKHNLSNDNYEDLDEEIFLIGKEENKIKHLNFEDSNHEQNGLILRNTLNNFSDLLDAEGSEINKDSIIKAIKISKEKVKQHLRELKNVEDSSVLFKVEAERYQNESINLNIENTKKETFLNELETINNKIISDDDSLNYSTFIRYFIDLSFAYKEEHSKIQSLVISCINKVKCSLKSQYTFEDYLKHHKVLKEILLLMKSLILQVFGSSEDIFNSLEGDHMFSNKAKIHQVGTIQLSDKVLANFLYFIVVEDLINYIINIWNVKEYEKIIEVFKFYSDVIPKILTEYIYNSVIIPRLVYFIRENFKGGENVHLWVLPWLEIIDVEMLRPVFKVVQESIEKRILDWDMHNLKVIEVLKPWKRIFTAEYLNDLIVKYILPKLTYLISKMSVNPKDQDIQPIKILFKWQNEEFVSIKFTSQILVSQFFPKWLTVLEKWLVGDFSLSKFEEIQEWYEGWKNLFIKNNLLEVEEVKNKFKEAMMLIIKYSNK